jgi:dihydroneopterin aldolase
VTTIHLRGLELRGVHGVYAEERERSQTFRFDVDLDVGERGRSDRLEDAVDYDEVARCVRDVSDARSYALLETLAAALAEELVRRFAVARATVTVWKPDVRPGDLEAGIPGVTVTRP